jgi:hypothetical protein
MDIIKYRKYIVNTDENLGKEKYWIRKYKSVPQWKKNNAYSYLKTGDILILNHPLVNSGEAYWSTNTKLCLGYKLEYNSNIFRPIFSYSRQKMINDFQDNINRIVLKREEKRAYIAMAKMKKLPIVLVDNIIGMIY